MKDSNVFRDPGEMQLLVHRNGASEAIQTFGTSDVSGLFKALRLLPFAPQSHKPLLVPSVAALYDEDEHSKKSAGKSTGPVDFAWLRIECLEDNMIEKVLRFFPVHSSTREKVMGEKSGAEIAEIFTSCGYVCICIEAKGESKHVMGEDRSESVTVFIIAFERFLITVQQKPIAGGAEMRTQMESMISSRNSNADPVSVLVCGLISGIVKEYQKEPSSLLVDVDNVNEMVLQIQPSKDDQGDLLRRIEDLRHRLSRMQASFLAKERLVQQLLLPVMRHIFITSEASVAARYQRLLSGLLLSIERLRKGRDVLNLSSMSVVSGVAMRLLQHCHWMDFLNNVMTQMSLVTMPICIIPGIFTMNVRVPFEDSEGLTAFFVIAAVTLVVFCAGMAYPVYAYFRYKPPGALVSPNPF